VADWANKKVTILGLGRSGASAARYLSRHGAQVLLSEGGTAAGSEALQAELASLGVKIEVGGHSDQAISFGEVILTSPGIPPTAEVIQKATQLGKEIICDVELAYRQTSAPIIAVTGTNGKSTTCALISHILSKTGKLAPACGNFGVPILDQLEKKPDYLVVEVSSFQLEYCSAFAPHVAVWMNLTPDHLDWHGSLDSYVNAKRKMFANQEPSQYAVLNQDDPIVSQVETRAEIFPFSASSELTNAVQGAFMKDGFLSYRYFGRTRIVCAPEELQIIGKHNLENALAAISAAAIVDVDPSEIEAHLKGFKALEHRLEYVATVDGVPYYNDSKATNTASAIKALEAFPDRKVVLIAGGKDKGTPLDDLVSAVGRYAASVILIGQAADRFDQALKQGGFAQIHRAGSLEEAVELGGQLKLGPVLLSPACASFDMFKDYEDRGRVFKDLVHARLARLTPSA
jgi:UDP-N-acetylmuramoylalanine--D-glutamate ligase